MVGGTPQCLNSVPTVVLEHETIDDRPVIINQNWNETDRGLFLRLKAGTQLKATTYEGALAWELQDVVANE